MKKKSVKTYIVHGVFIALVVISILIIIGKKVLL